MNRIAAERAQTDRFNEFYATGTAPVVQAICDAVCGCGYIGNSWTTRDEADTLIGHLALQPGLRLLELGAGAGWPGLYLAAQSGCQAVLVDLPEVGLQIARQRAEADGISDRVEIVAADATALPFRQASFDAINHSDLLCCLKSKRAVLVSCRSVLKPAGRMVFSVISVAPGLSPAQRRRAIADGPDFIESDEDYATMLGRTGWVLQSRRDMTDAYAAACERQIAADQREAAALTALLGAARVHERLANWKSKLSSIRDRLTIRELFVATPAS